MIKPSDSMHELAAVTWSRVTEVGIWIGLGLLSLTLIILTLTRWGNAKTTHKCVALSVFAHLLLVMYACQAHVLMPGSEHGSTEKLVGIQVVSDTEEVDDAVHEAKPPILERSSEEHAPLSTSLAAPKLLVAQEKAEFGDSDEISVVIPLPAAAPPLLEVARPTAADGPTSEPPPDDPNANETKTEDVSHDAVVESEPELQDSADATSSAQAEPSLAQTDADRENELADTIEPPIAKTDVGELPSSNDRGPQVPSAPTFRPRTSVESEPAPLIYALRDPSQRHANALKRGGNESTEAAVNNALRWLASHQQTDGRWNPRLTEAGREFRVLGHDRQGAGGDADTALTGLAVLAFMGAGHDHLHGEYSENVRTGLEFILKSQAGSGHLAGDASLFAHMYSHGIATLAVSEAYALSGDQRLKPFVERAVAYSLAAQDPRGGGWRYQPGESGDMSQFGWQVMALKSAQLGGMHLPTTTVERMKAFLDSCTSGRYAGLAAYRPGQQPSATMTAEALACRYFLGQAVPDRTADEAARFILQQPPGGDEVDYYLWYYATFALYQSGGESWETWNRKLQKQLISTQTQEGHHAGSWEPNGKWCGYGGRVFSTALAAMCLEVYYRYLPMMREQVARR